LLRISICSATASCPHARHPIAAQPIEIDAEGSKSSRNSCRYSRDPPPGGRRVREVPLRTTAAAQGAGAGNHSTLVGDLEAFKSPRARHYRTGRRELICVPPAESVAAVLNTRFSTIIRSSGLLKLPVRDPLGAKYHSSVPSRLKCPWVGFTSGCVWGAGSCEAYPGSWSDGRAQGVNACTGKSGRAITSDTARGATGRMLTPLQAQIGGSACIRVNRSWRPMVWIRPGNYTLVARLRAWRKFCGSVQLIIVVKAALRYHRFRTIRTPNVPHRR